MKVATSVLCYQVPFFLFATYHGNEVNAFLSSRPRGASSSSSHLFLASSSGGSRSMDELARQWSTRNKDGSTGTPSESRGGSAVMTMDPSMPPGGQDFGMMDFSQNKIDEGDRRVQNWVTGNGSSQPKGAAHPADVVVVNGAASASTSTAGLMDQLQREWAARNRDDATGSTSSSVMPPAPAPAVLVPVYGKTSTSMTMNQLQREWQMQNGEELVNAALPVTAPLAAMESVEPEQPAAMLNSNKPAAAAAAATSIEELAKEWAARNKDDAKPASAVASSVTPLVTPAPVPMIPVPVAQPVAASTAAQTTSSTAPSMPSTKSAMGDLAKERASRNKEATVVSSLPSIMPPLLTVAAVSAAPSTAEAAVPQTSPVADSSIPLPPKPGTSYEDMKKIWGFSSQDLFPPATGVVPLASVSSSSSSSSAAEPTAGRTKSMQELAKEWADAAASTYPSNDAEEWSAFAGKVPIATSTAPVTSAAKEEPVVTTPPPAAPEAPAASAAPTTSDATAARMATKKPGDVPTTVIANIDDDDNITDDFVPIKEIVGFGVALLTFGPVISHYYMLNGQQAFNTPEQPTVGIIRGNRPGITNPMATDAVISTPDNKFKDPISPMKIDAVIVEEIVEAKEEATTNNEPEPLGVDMLDRFTEPVSPIKEEPEIAPLPSIEDATTTTKPVAGSMLERFKDLVAPPIKNDAVRTLSIEDDVASEPGKDSISQTEAIAAPEEMVEELKPTADVAPIKDEPKAAETSPMTAFFKKDAEKKSDAKVEGRIQAEEKEGTVVEPPKVEVVDAMVAKVASPIKDEGKKESIDVGSAKLEELKREKEEPKASEIGPIAAFFKKDLEKKGEDLTPKTTMPVQLEEEISKAAVEEPKQEESTPIVSEEKAKVAEAPKVEKPMVGESDQTEGSSQKDIEPLTKSDQEVNAVSVEAIKSQEMKKDMVLVEKEEPKSVIVEDKTSNAETPKIEDVKSKAAIKEIKTPEMIKTPETMKMAELANKKDVAIKATELKIRDNKKQVFIPETFEEVMSQLKKK